MKRTGFTLIELLVVIGIISMLVAIAIPNFLSARQRSSDSKRKQEMGELKTALRLYNNDFNQYPQAFNGGVGKLNYIAGCHATDVNGKETGTGQCPCNTTADFATGVACDNIYMKKFPSTLGSSMYYYPQTSGYNDFCLVTTLDNKSDPDIQASQARCAGVCGANCSSAGKYCACAD